MLRRTVALLLLLSTCLLCACGHDLGEHEGILEDKTPEQLEAAEATEACEHMLIYTSAVNRTGDQTLSGYHVVYCGHSANTNCNFVERIEPHGETTFKNEDFNGAVLYNGKRYTYCVWSCEDCNGLLEAKYVLPEYVEEVSQ